jgi:hypothetical protein
MALRRAMAAGNLHSPGLLNDLAGRAGSPGFVIGAEWRNSGVRPINLVPGSAAVGIVPEPGRRSVGREWSWFAHRFCAGE